MQTIDLVDYLTIKGFKVVKSGSSYKIVDGGAAGLTGDLSSLSIFANRKSWKRWSNGTHGGDAIEFLRVVYGMTYQQACQELGAVLPSSAPALVPVSALVLPPRTSEKFSCLFAYLIKKRGISADIIKQLVTSDKIYQDVRGNVVFLGRDDVQNVRFASVRGTGDKPYKLDCSGSDKRFSFSLPGIDTNNLYIFESPIDALSAATLSNFISHDSDRWLLHSRLSLGGVSDVALQHYLSCHDTVKILHFWLDNDSVGRSSADFLCRKYAAQGYKCINHCPKRKDFNEDLQIILRNMY